MYDILSTPRGPNPIELFKAVQGPTIANWVIHRSRRKREKEVYQDYKRFPWRGERQAQIDPLRTTLMANALDRELAAVPARVRQALPPSGNYPSVTDIELGPGPNPFLDKPENPDEMATRLQEQELLENPSNWKDGPGSHGKHIWQDIFKAFSGDEKALDQFMGRMLNIDKKQEPTVEEDGQYLDERTGRKIRMPHTRRPLDAAAPPANPPPIGNMGSGGGAVPGGGLVDPTGLPNYAAPHRPQPKRQREEDDAPPAAVPPGRRQRIH